MKTLPIAGLLLSGLLLVLMSCAEIPTSLEPGDLNLDVSDNDPRISLNAPQQVLAQAQGLIVVDLPRQTVDALRDGVETQAQVSARIRISPDGKATGSLRWKTDVDGQVVIQALTGAGTFDGKGALVLVEIEFREANGELVVATVTPNASYEDCLIWDLVNGSTALTGRNNFPFSVSFEASGEIIVR